VTIRRIIVSSRINPFVLEANQYKRDIAVLAHYLKDASCYLSTMTGRSQQYCGDWLKKQLKPGGRFAFKDPKVKMLERQENGDRKEVETSLFKFLSATIKEKDVIAATLTTYLPVSTKKSLLAVFIGANIKKRSKAKKEMFAAKSAGDKTLTTVKNIEQINAKQANNSLSGAHVSKSTPLFNKTAHSTLTSTCRSTSGYGNANNEKFLAGNRHYWSPNITINNIISIINHSDYAKISSVMAKYGLKEPTREEVLKAIHRCTHHYWRDDQGWRDVVAVVDRLSGLQRAAFLYTGDFYHLKELNPEFIRGFLGKLITRCTHEHPDPDSVFKDCHEDQRSLATQIHQFELLPLCPLNPKTGEPENAEISKFKGQPVYARVASTLEHIENTINEHGDFIQAFFVTGNLPASLGVFPDSIRKVAVTSDTDSTIFTVQDWVQWYSGRISFEEEGMSVAATMIYLSAATITDILARMSANFGVSEDSLFKIAMKNEFKFDVFVATQVAKHYYAYISCQEGQIFSKHQEEIKGVHLKSSSVSKQVMKTAKEMMIDIMKTIMAEKPVDLHALVKQIGDIERDVYQAIAHGSPEFFKFVRINSPDSYKGEAHKSNYRHHLFWNEVFGLRDGEMPTPPYSCCNVSTDLDSATKTREWIENMEDRELAARVSAYLTKYDKKYLGTVWIPHQIVQRNGMPKEILDAMNARRIVKDACNVFYIVLETLGVYLSNDKLTKLVSDYY
jgi:hypothetical protein